MANAKKIAIITDSNSGIFPDEYASQGVFVLPVPFIVNGKTFFENITLTQDKFYQLLDDNVIVSTSQPSIGEVTEFWRDHLKIFDEIVHIPMSRALSNSYDTATILAREPEFQGKVFVVNNRRIATTQKASVLDAIALREQGKTATEIKEYLEQTALDSVVYIAVDSMKYLKRGGRITPAAATIGTVLKMKPILKIYGEELDKFALPRSTNKAIDIMIDAIRNDLETRFSEYVSKGEIMLCVEHTNNQENAVKLFEALKEIFPNVILRSCSKLPLCASCHIGPKALAITCTRVIK